jgi:hypothetical protein
LTAGYSPAATAIAYARFVSPAAEKHGLARKDYIYNMVIAGGPKEGFRDLYIVDSA